MRKFWFSPSIVGNGLLWIVALAMQIGGWVNQAIAFTLIGFAILWSVMTFLYWLIWRKKDTGKQQRPRPVPPPLDRSVKEKLPDGRTLTSYPPRIFITSPGSEEKIQKVMFRTESGGEVKIPTNGRPQKLRFLHPHEQIVLENDLPIEIPTGDGRLVVKLFTPTGFLMEEIGTNDVQVEVEVYLKPEANKEDSHS